LKASEKSSGSKDNDVKMSDAEVTTQPIHTNTQTCISFSFQNYLMSLLCTQGSSNRSGEPSIATSEEGINLKCPC